MKIKNGFELRNVCGENVIIAHGVENIDFTKVITLNESAALIWRQVEGKDFTEQDMTTILLTAVLSAVYFGSRKLMKKGLSPIALIGISAIMGILVYGR